MIRNFKVLGLALVVAFALSATAAATASANFDSEAEVTKLSGGQSTTHEFTVNAGSTTCEEASFPGESTGVLTGGAYTAETLTIKPVYSKCSSVVLGEKRTTHVNMNGCDYLFKSGATTESGTKVHGTVDVVCPAGQSIDVQITGAEICTITVPAQTNVAGITYHNTGTGSARDVDVTANVSTLKYTQHGFLCPGNAFSSTKTFTNGKYTGSTTEVGKNTLGNPVGIWVT